MTAPTLRYRLARSEHPAARMVRRMVRAGRRVSLPAPRLVILPLARMYTLLRGALWTVKRVLIAEPWAKAHLQSYGRGLRASHFLHFFSGAGDIRVGDDVHLAGKIDVVFAAILPRRPCLVIGSRTYVGHQVSFVVADRVTIGDDVMLAQGVHVLDSPGHPLDAVARRAGRPAAPDQIRPVVVDDGAWIGTDVMLMPGVTVGARSVVAARSVVTADVPPDTLVAGTPARVVRTLVSEASG